MITVLQHNLFHLASRENLEIFVFGIAQLRPVLLLGEPGITKSNLPNDAARQKRVAVRFAGREPVDIKLSNRN